MTPARTCTAFQANHRFASGSFIDVALAIARATRSTPHSPAILVFDDSTGRAIDFDTRGTADDIAGRLATPVFLASAPDTFDTPNAPDLESRGRGRPKLGVIAREITLLPRHWDWLANQPGGASVALRKLVEQARRATGASDRHRAAQSAAYNFMSAVAGNLQNFEEAARALFASDRRRFTALIASWPPDLRDHAAYLAFADLDPSEAAPGE